MTSVLHIKHVGKMGCVSGQVPVPALFVCLPGPTLANCVITLFGRTLFAEMNAMLI